MKNPPAGAGGSKKERSSKKDRSKKNGDAEAKEKNGSGSGSGEGSENGDLEVDGASDDEFTRRINAEAKELGPAAVEDKEDDDWAVDMSEEAVRKRQEDLEKTLKATNLADEDDEDESGDNPYEALGSWIVAERSSDKEIDDIEVYKKATELGIATKHKTLVVLAQTIFDENIIKKKQIAAHAPLLKKMITSERHQRAFLGGTERFVGKDHPELISQVPNILMQFYQEDLITEESVTSWGTKASKKYVDLSTSKKVRKAAEPFLKWLEEAEDESEDEDDDE